MSANIFLTEARILAHTAHAGGQQVLRLHAPECATAAQPGQFVHLRCHAQLALRRPLSLLRTDPQAGWVEVLYKVVGQGTALLASQPVGATLSLLGPIGQGYTVPPHCRQPVLLGGGVGMPPMFFWAQQLRARNLTPWVVLGSEVPFPFTARPSQFLIPGLPPEVIAAAPLLEDWGVPSRLASLQGYPGCFEGYVTELAERWLRTLTPDVLAGVVIYACGPHPMLHASARLAQRFGLASQLALEEFMACGVGGCAGCTVELHLPTGRAMKRVCVDGPVFAGDAVFPPLT